MGHKYMDTDAKVRGTMKEQPHPRGKGTLGDIERRAGCQRRLSDGHEKQAMCLNQGGSIVAAAFIAKKESKEKSY
jgi:hypothetical protein